MYTKRELEAGPIYGPRGQQGALFFTAPKVSDAFCLSRFWLFSKNNYFACKPSDQIHVLTPMYVYLLAITNSFSYMNIALLAEKA